MIHASSCAVSLTHCHFRNDSVAERLSGGAIFEELHADGPEGGLDVLLDAGEGDRPACVAVLHCQSYSTQFLVTSGGVAGDATGDNRDGRDSTIVGLRHDTWFQHDARPPALPDELLRRPLEWVVIEPDPPIASPKPTLSQLDTAVQLGDRIVAPPAQEPTPGKSTGVEPLPPAVSSKVLDAGWQRPEAVHLEGSVKKADTVLLPVPPAIFWRGAAQAGASLTLCGCRFDRGQGEHVAPAVLGRFLVRPIVDLGILRGDPRAREELLAATAIATDAETVDVPPSLSAWRL